MHITPPTNRRTAFAVARRFVKVTALVVGGLVSLLCLSALARPIVDSLWIRIGVAAVLLVIVPLVLSEPLLPKDDPSRGRGLPTDLMALSWMGFALVFVAALRSFSAPVLAEEAGALAASDHGVFATSTAFLAGESAPALSAVEPAPAPAPVAVASSAAPSVVRVPDAGVAAELGDAGTQAATPAPERPRVATADLAPAEVFRRWAPSVVFVQTGEGHGTGFILDADGLVATNSHVVHGERMVGVKLIDGTWASEVFLVADDEERDLALLRIRVDTAITPVVLANADGITVGERAISIGNPLGLEHTLTDGLVSARRVYEGQTWIQMSTPVSPGNSGGPIFNARGEVIGVTTQQLGAYSRGQNLNLAVPVDDLQRLVSADHPPPVRVGRGPLHNNGTW